MSATPVRRPAHTDLVQRTAVATDRTELARALEEHLREMFEPRSLRVYLRRADGGFAAPSQDAPAELATLAADLRPIDELKRRGGCWVSGQGDEIGGWPLDALEPRCLILVTDRRGEPMGLLVLGARPAGRTYDMDDVARLSAIALHAGTALEVLQLAEQLAERMDVERRVEREIAIARDVQGRLLPQGVPRLASVELAARCIQARSVGGDYYDFLDLGPDQVGLVLADVSGKGVHAALRRANLQAHVRSQASSAPQDPLRVLRQVNRMLCESTETGHFATLFLGVYNDASRRLAYINCGHNPPLCLRRDGRVESLEATATVLGVFDDWQCGLGRLQLVPGDRLVAYSDGVTEATRGEEQFGEARLLEVLNGIPDATPDEMVSAILAAVQAFGAGEQSDDLTLLVAKVRSPDAARR